MTEPPCLSSRPSRQGRFYRLLACSRLSTRARIRVSTVQYMHSQSDTLRIELTVDIYAKNIYLNKCTVAYVVQNLERNIHKIYCLTIIIYLRGFYWVNILIVDVNSVYKD